MEQDLKDYLAGTFVPTERQVSRMDAAGFQFPDPLIQVVPPRKKRDSRGKEIPVNLDDPESRSYLIQNPALERNTQGVALNLTK